MTDSVALILAFLPIHFAVMVSPGPNFVLLSTIALSIGRLEALRAALGIAVGSLIWMIAAAIGISVILETLPILGFALKIVGGLYLIYLGYKLWISKGPVRDDTIDLRAEETVSFRRGLIANLTNPKSAAYFGSIFAAFLTDDVSPLLLAGLIPSLFLISILWHGALATMFSADAVRRPYLKFARGINRIAGVILALFGLKLVAAASTT